MEGVRRIVPLDCDSFAIDKAIELEGGAQGFYLLQDLLHLAVSKGRVVQPVDATVVLEEDVRPVLEQILFRRIAQHLRLPTLIEEEGDQRVFKIRFFVEYHRCLLRRTSSVAGLPLHA